MDKDSNNTARNGADKGAPASDDRGAAPSEQGPASHLFGQKSGAPPWEDAPASPGSPASPEPPLHAASNSHSAAAQDALERSLDTSSAPYPRDASYTPRPASGTGETGAEDALVFSDVDEAVGADALRRLHPNYKLLMRFAALFVAVVIVIAALVAEAALSDNTQLPFGLVFGPAFLLAAFVAIRVPLSRYNARGYQISRDRLRVVRGVMFRSDTIVPFGRVQHIDVDQGPVERALGIATLTLHTAGNHNSSVHLPGLGHGLAVEMREAIRAHIKRETL